MATELVLDASVSLAWFLKETPERAAYAAAVSAAAADGAILHLPVQWGIEVGHEWGTYCSASIGARF